LINGVEGLTYENNLTRGYSMSRDPEKYIFWGQGL